MPISYDAKAGKAWMLDQDGAWVPTRIARNPSTGEAFALDGTEWKLLPAAPADEAPERSTAARAARMAEFAGQGLIDRTAELVGAPADLFWQGAKAVGLPTPGVSAGDTLKGYVKSGREAVNRVLAPVMPDIGPDRPETQGERVAYAAGGGAGDALSFVVPGGAAAKFARAGGLPQAVGKALAAQPGTQMVSGAVGGGVTEATDNPWLGLAASLATPQAMRAGGRLVSPASSRLTPEQQRLAAYAKGLDIPLTPGQATGSRALRSLESVFGTLPTTSGRQQAVQRTQQGAFNREALRNIGEPGVEATDDVLNNARQRIGGKIENLAAQTTVRADQQFLADLTDTVSQYSRRLDVQRRPVFEGFVADIGDYLVRQGAMPGDIYQKTRSQLSRMAQSYGGTDPYYAEALRSLRDALDKVAARSMPGNRAGEWTDARRQWGNLRTIEKSRSNTTAAAAGGDIPPTAFANAVRQQNPRGYAFGDGPMNRLSKVGTAFIRDPVPNSGTPERMYWQNLMQHPYASLGVGGTAMTALAADPVKGALGAVATLATAPLAQKAYYSRYGQMWLKNRVMDGRKPEYNAGLLGTIAGGNAIDAYLDGRIGGLIPVPLEE